MVAVPRHHADFRLCQRPIGLDAVYEGCAAGRRGEKPLEHDDLGLARRDGLQRRKRLGIGKGQKLAIRTGGALLERRQQVGRGDKNGTRARQRVGMDR